MIIISAVIKFITEVMKNWKVELTVRGRIFTELKIQRDKFQVDALSPLLIVTEMMPLIRIIRKNTEGYKFPKSQEQINQLMHIDDIKLFAKNEKECYSNSNKNNIQTEYRNGIW